MATETDGTIPQPVEARHARSLMTWGLLASAAYVAGMGIYAWFGWPHMLKLSPDEFATFLSGVFAPLAFLWLVLGFKQQGDELQNSARALWLQGEELRNSVEQQRQLVEVSREQLAADYGQRLMEEEEAEISAQPQLVMDQPGGVFRGDSKRAFRISVKNAGPTCSLVVLYAEGWPQTKKDLLNPGESIATEIRFSSSEEVAPVNVRVDYSDRRGNRRAQLFAIPVEERGSPHQDRVLGEPRKLAKIERMEKD